MLNFYQFHERIPRSSRWQRFFKISGLENFLSKCPGGYQILHRELQLNSKNSVGKYKKKLNLPQLVNFHWEAKQNF